MSRSRRSKAVGVLGALGALVAALLVVVVSPMVVSALPAGCTSTWNGNVNSDWSNAGNWSAGVPNSSSAVACVPGGKSVVLSGAATVNQVHMDANAVVTVAAATGSLFLDENSGPAQVGGPGRLDVAGNLVISGAARWVTNAFVHALNPGLVTVGSSAFISADWGTATTIDAGATLELGGAGGYYQGTPVGGQPISKLTNNGSLAKTGGGTASIVDADYAQGASGAVNVDCCAVLAFAGQQLVTGLVQPNWGLGTSACGAGTFSICGGSADPAVDPSNAVLQLSNNAGNPANVQVQELAQPPDTTDSRAIGNDVFAHADGLVTDKTQPATITLRFSQADVMSTPLNEVQVGHISDAGVMTKTPDCIGQDLPAGANYCIVRPVARNAQNTYVSIKTIETSRWRLRRTGPTENFDQTAPGAPSGLSAAKVSPFDGSQVGLTWQPPANDGGAAVSAYRIYRDGTLVSTTGPGASAVVKDSGPGKHVFTVAAVNALGESARASVEITLAKMSTPRKLTTLRGKKGGKLTAGVKWKAPASAGGLTITGYQVKVLTAGGRKVKVAKVSADKLRYMLKLKPGRYVFKVRARNAGGNGPWSKATDPVRPR